MHASAIGTSEATSRLLERSLSDSRHGERRAELGPLSSSAGSTGKSLKLASPAECSLNTSARSASVALSAPMYASSVVRGSYAVDFMGVFTKAVRIDDSLFAERMWADAWPRGTLFYVSSRIDYVLRPTRPLCKSLRCAESIIPNAEEIEVSHHCDASA